MACLPGRRGAHLARIPANPGLRADPDRHLRDPPPDLSLALSVGGVQYRYLQIRGRAVQALAEGIPARTRRAIHHPHDAAARCSCRR